MSYPFDTDFYDEVYSSISSELKIKFPQQQDEDIIVWYKRLLYEFMKYVQSKYESSSQEIKINPNKKGNKKKDNPSTSNFTPTNTALFETNIENALDIVSQDSNFAIYLLIEWIPLLIGVTDHVSVCAHIDSSETKANNIGLTSVEISFDLFNIRKILINGYNLSSISLNQYDSMSNDPFIKSMFKCINNIIYGDNSFDYDSIKNSSYVNLGTDVISNSFKIGNLLYKIKNITQSLFIKSICLKSNLIVENSGKLEVTKEKSEKSNRKKFNGRKYIDTETVTQNEISSGIMQTVMIYIFRTYYDFDKDTIDQKLFDYLFLKKRYIL